MSRTRSATLAAGALAAVLLLSSCGEEPATGAGAGTTPAATPAATPSETSGESAEGAAHNESDVAFLTMMIPHHTQSTTMSGLVLARDDLDPAVLALAAEINAVEEPQIGEMRGLLEEWGNPEPSSEPGEMSTDHMGMDHSEMMPMLSTAEMDRIKKANPDKAARLYLEYMVAHHVSSLEMAEAQATDGVNPAAVAMAQDIVTVQTAQLAELQALLGVSPAPVQTLEPGPDETPTPAVT